MSVHERPELSEKAKKIIAASSIAVFILLTLAVAWFIGRPMLRFVSEPERFRAWVDSGRIMSRVYFLGMQLLQVFFAIIPGEPMELGAGYAFGAVEGTLLCLAGTVAGSMAVFFFVRRFGIRAVEIFFSREKIESLRFLRDTRKRNTRDSQGPFGLFRPAHGDEPLDLALYNLRGEDTVHNNFNDRRKRARRSELRVCRNSPWRNAPDKRSRPSHLSPHLPCARGARKKGGRRPCRISCS